MDILFYKKFGTKGDQKGKKWKGEECQLKSSVGGSEVVYAVNISVHHKAAIESDFVEEK